MNFLSKLSDSELLIQTKKVVGEEKRITQNVLNHLEEVELRKLHLERGFSSLYDYCIKELGYSESSANRRISAMRVIKNIPEAKEKLALGSVNLSTLTQLHGFLGREVKSKTYSQEMKLELLEKIENKSQSQCEREFVKIAPESVICREREKPITEDLTQVTFVMSVDLRTKLERLKNLMAHKNTNSMAELLEVLADMALKKLEPSSTSAAAKRCVKPQENDTRNIQVETKRLVWRKGHEGCQFIDKETKKRCGSTYALQIDHIHPYSLGGSNHESNLRLLCRNHNQWRTRELN